MYKSKREGGLGFRNMQVFNKALFAKQAWRVMTMGESLVAKVLKGKYFPTKSFMEATVPPNSSYTWRSIVSAREVLTKGARKAVGDGSTIRIWGDPWVPKLPMRVAIGEEIHEDQPTMVGELIENKTWKEEELRKMFSPWEVEAIMCIPVLLYDTQDCWTWEGSKDGEYSVRSAYYRSLRDDSAGKATTSHSQGSFEWKKLWSSRVMPKI